MGEETPGAQAAGPWPAEAAHIEMTTVTSVPACPCHTALGQQSERRFATERNVAQAPAPLHLGRHFNDGMYKFPTRQFRFPHATPSRSRVETTRHNVLGQSRPHEVSPAAGEARGAALGADGAADGAAARPTHLHTGTPLPGGVAAGPGNLLKTGPSFSTRRPQSRYLQHFKFCSFNASVINFVIKTFLLHISGTHGRRDSCPEESKAHRRVI